MDGYWKIADLMGSHTEFAIFRRFRSLNMQNLLYLQAEIIHLEEELVELALRDARHPGRGSYSKDWWSLARGTDHGDQDQWGMILELRGKLDAYS